MSTKADLSVFDTMYNEVCDSVSRDTFFYELFDGELDEVCSKRIGEETYGQARSRQLTLIASYDYEHIESAGGGEGEGEYCYGIIKFQDKYYKAEWSYYSYEGCDYTSIVNTIVEVSPVEKTITVYE
jgi:hypothetical protein